MTTATCQLAVSDIEKHYQLGSSRIDVLRGVSMEVAPGESVAIMGPSGCGKSTLLNIIGGLEAPDAGTVRVGDESPYSLDDSALAEFRNRRVGFVFQSHHLLPQCTVVENVLIPTLVAAGRGDARSRASALLERVGLTNRENHRPAELSGGERQRVALARALINEPALLLADEPTGNLDEETASRVADLLCEIQTESNTSLIVVTHSPTIASRFGRRLTLSEGRLVNSNHDRA